jgi:SAM-dependent methyltransferase
MNDEAIIEEFDTMATWTADAVTELGEEYALPAACRGSGSPAALDWLCGQLDLGAGTRLLDSGAGVGGPAEYAASRLGVLPTLVEPMEGACRAARRLFGHPVVAADGAALPFANGVFDAGWSLGVLCTVEDKERHLTEMVRAVRPGGALGLLVFVRLVDELPQEPEANEFPTMAELDAAVQRVGLAPLERARIADFPASPPAWADAADEVTKWIGREHGDEEGWRTAQAQQQSVIDLIETGLIVGQFLICRTPAGW